MAFRLMDINKQNHALPLQSVTRLASRRCRPTLFALLIAPTTPCHAPAPPRTVF